MIAGRSGWKFQSEQALEEFIWLHLEPLLGLQPLSRQYYSNNQVCDILAVGANRQLTILELKNAEDRYIVQQLTRYYSNLLAEKPFPEQVDYSLPIRLLAIAPTFHSHNLIDREFSRLELELWLFNVLREQERFCFELRLFNTRQIWRLSIPCITASATDAVG
jgi:RecB family endonuclease NucS